MGAPLPSACQFEVTDLETGALLLPLSLEGPELEDTSSQRSPKCRPKVWRLIAAGFFCSVFLVSVGRVASRSWPHFSPWAEVGFIFTLIKHNKTHSCRDAEGWTDGTMSCKGNPQFGADSALCAFGGWTCQGYAKLGRCANGMVLGLASAADNFPERACCACGGGSFVEEMEWTPPPTETPFSSSCHTAKPGEQCFQAIMYAFTDGFRLHPDWFGNGEISTKSSFEEVQAYFHEKSREECPAPCPPPPCHTAQADEECYEAVLWVLQHGLFEHPEWYSGISSASELEEIQSVVHQGNGSLCPQPCPPPPCATAEHGDPCYETVRWAMTDGIYAHPEWYPGLFPESSSFEEFQNAIHLANRSLCRKACLLSYQVTDQVSYKALQPDWLMKGMAYGPSPLKSPGQLMDDDFMSYNASVLWSPWGRGDLRTMRAIGANTARLYGNDPNLTKRGFLDEALKEGLDVIAGISDWPFINAPDACRKKNWYCYDQVYENYYLSLKHGFTINHFSAYHPALKAVILMNEPDLKIHPRSLACRAVITAFDAVLQAEKDLGVTGNPVAFTATWSFAQYPPAQPGLGQMLELLKCVQNSSAPPTSYIPRNNIMEAFKKRFVNSFNTANPAKDVEKLFLVPYKASEFWDGGNLHIPVFIGEYHCVQVSVKKDMQDLVATAKDPNLPFFMGANFFEFSVRYDKGGTEEDFGMFAYGSCALAEWDYFGDTYTVWNLRSQRDMFGYPLQSAVAEAYGGVTHVQSPSGRLQSKSSCAMVDPS